jgi:uncharacterized small protein (DUF1192 family)
MMKTVQQMPGASPILEYLWKIVRENPAIIPDLVRVATDRFGSAPPQPAPRPEPPPSLDPLRERLDQLESDLAAAGRLIGEAQSRIESLEQRIARADAELARQSAGTTALARKLRTAVLVFAPLLGLISGLVVYLLVARR